MSALSLLPQYVLDLIEIYGPPRKDGWAAAVFYDRVEPGSDLDDVALQHYQYYVSDCQRRSSFIDWLQSWKRIYQRPINVQADFFRDLRDATRAAGLDYEDRLSDKMDINISFQDGIEGRSVQANAAKAKILAAAFDAPEVEDFHVYRIGDSEVLEGFLMVAGRANGEVITLAYMHD